MYCGKEGQGIFISRSSKLKRSPRRQHRMILNSPPPMDTPNLHLHMDHFLLKKIWKLDKLFSTTKDQRTTLRRGGGAETQSHTQNTHPQCSNTQQGGFSPDRCLSWRSEGLVPHIRYPQPLESSLERQAPKMSCLEKQQGWSPRDPKCYRKLRFPFSRAYHKIQWNNISLESV